MSRRERLRLFAAHEQEALRIARGMRKRLPSSIQTGDLEAAARMGLWGAICRGRNVDPRQFAWYISTCVRGSLRDELRRHEWLPRRERKREGGISVVYMEQVEGWQRQLLPKVEQELSMEEQIDLTRQAELLEELLLELDTRSRKIMRLVLGGMTQAEVSEKIGVSPPRVNQLVTRSRQRMAASVQLRKLQRR